ncbi:hypothetical protein [Inquilinus sp.]|uniref:hypothetical protein n=1 Tax=Inquilinus sp. TaxID=1932117 RepID=UPI003783A9E4
MPTAAAYVSPDGSIKNSIGNIQVSKNSTGLYKINLVDTSSSTIFITVTPHSAYITASANLDSEIGGGVFYVQTGFTDKGTADLDYGFNFVAVWND